MSFSDTVKTDLKEAEAFLRGVFTNIPTDLIPTPDQVSGALDKIKAASETAIDAEVAKVAPAFAPEALPYIAKGMDDAIAAIEERLIALRAQRAALDAPVSA
jgi:hypothetical protein